MVETDSLTIVFAADGDLLRAVVHGRGTYASTLHYWREIAAEVLRRSPRRLLLVDETTGTPLSAEEWKALVDAMSNAGFDRVRIAHVKPFGLQRIEYCELFAREIGIDARVFTNEVEATFWLRYGEQSRRS